MFPKRNLKTGHLIFLDIRDSPAENILRERKINKLDFKTMGPYAVFTYKSHKLDMAVNGIPECRSSDRVLPAPHGAGNVHVCGQEKN